MLFHSLPMMALAASASASVLPRATSLPGPFNVTGFQAFHVIHATSSVISFNVSNADPAIMLNSTSCSATSIPPGDPITLGQFSTVNQCTNKEAGFVFSQNQEGQYVLEVLYGGYATGTYQGRHVFPKKDIALYQDPDGYKYEYIKTKPDFSIDINQSTNTA